MNMLVRQCYRSTTMAVMTQTCRMIHSKLSDKEKSHTTALNLLNEHSKKHRATIPLKREVPYMINETSLRDIVISDYELMRSTETVDWTKLSEDEKRLITLIQMEHSLCFHMGCKVPKILTDQMALYMLRDRANSHRRASQLVDWFGIEEILENSDHPLHSIITSYKPTPDPPPKVTHSKAPRTQYPDTIILIGSTDEKHYKHKLLSARLHGPELVIDCRLIDADTNKKTQLTVLKNLEALLKVNLKLRTPYAIKICNADSKCETIQLFEEKGVFDNLAVEVLPGPLLDHYSAPELLCVTPYSIDVLERNDVSNHVMMLPLMSAIMMNTREYPTMCGQQAIRHVQLPIDRHVIWQGGFRGMTLERNIQILHDCSLSRSWHDILHSYLPPSAITPKKKRKKQSESLVHRTTAKNSLENMMTSEIDDIMRETYGDDHT